MIEVGLNQQHTDDTTLKAEDEDLKNLEKG